MTGVRATRVATERVAASPESRHGADRSAVIRRADRVLAVAAVVLAGGLVIDQTLTGVPSRTAWPPSPRGENGEGGSFRGSPRRPLGRMLVDTPSSASVPAAVGLCTREEGGVVPLRTPSVPPAATLDRIPGLGVRVPVPPNRLSERAHVAPGPPRAVD